MPRKPLRQPLGVDARHSALTGRVTYRIRWRDPASHRQLSHTFATRIDAIDALRSIQLAGDHCFCPKHCPPDAEPGSFGARGASALTWGTYARRYIANRPGIGEHYRAQFTRDLQLHMRPLLDLDFDQLNRDRVAEWIRGLEIAGLSATTIRRLVVEAGSVQRAAVDAGLATGNPFAKQRTGRRDRDVRKQMRCLSPEEWRRLQAALPEGPYRDMAVTLVGTGLRFGEVTALRVGSVELDHTPQRLHVEQAWKSDGAGGWILGPPKSRRSRRTITVGAEVAAALERNMRGKQSADLVFTAPGGGPLRNANFSHRVWRPAVAAAGLAGTRIHDLRHTHASWLLGKGRPILDVSRRLGHEDASTTTGIYGHILAGSEADDVATLDKIMPVSPPEDAPPTG